MICKNVVMPSTGRVLNIDRSLTTPSQTRRRITTPRAKKGVAVSKGVRAAQNVPVLQKGNSIGQTDSTTGLVILNEKILTTPERARLIVMQGDITDVIVDGIVHPSGGSVHSGGQVGTRIGEVGGAEYQSEVNAFVARTGSSNVPSCKAVIVPTRCLKCHYVVHCNGPNWSGGGQQPVSNLRKTIGDCLTKANKEGMNTLAFPSVGSGGAGFPKQLAAETILREIKSFLVGTSNKKLTTVYFILFDKQSVDVYVSELERLV